ncbi:MAG: hypothetical protein EOM03_15240 [Clostridia bacterium]|nr:hypothetical protein [Clostridia bacterium]
MPPLGPQEEKEPAPGQGYESQAQPVAYDETLLERCRTQWQFGDWESLTKINRDTILHHPDRAKLALLAAAGHAQVGDRENARLFIRLAQEWGCGKKLVAQILAAGMHNSLGRASVVLGYQTRALDHFEAAVAIGTPGSEGRLLGPARVQEQLRQLELPLAENIDQNPDLAIHPGCEQRMRVA